jgi:four helix bundle protein
VWYFGRIKDILALQYVAMRDHRSLHAWQEARAVVLATLELVRRSWRPYASALFSQLQRASLSVQLNIAEGYAYADSPSFTRHLRIAYGSAVETGELLEIAVDADIIPVDDGRRFLTRNQRCQRLLLGLVKSRRKR